jgi:hypothetical protein
LRHLNAVGRRLVTASLQCHALSNLAARWDDWIARTMHKPDRAKLPAVVALLL